MQRIPANKKIKSHPFVSILRSIIYHSLCTITKHILFGNYFKSIRSENRKRPALLVRMYKVHKLSSVTAAEKALLRTVSCSSFSSNRFSPFDFSHTYIKYVNLFSRAPFKSSSLMTKLKTGY